MDRLKKCFALPLGRCLGDRWWSWSLPKINGVSGTTWWMKQAFMCSYGVMDVSAAWWVMSG